MEETFAVTDLRPPNSSASAALLERVDSGGMNRDWAKPPAALDPSLQHIAVHMGGNIQFELTVPAGASRRVALALCEGWWKETGKRVQVLRVEGAEPKTVDTVADIGQNKAAAFWFDANGRQRRREDRDRRGSRAASRGQEHDSERPLGLCCGPEAPTARRCWPGKLNSARPRPHERDQARAARRATT